MNDVSIEFGSEHESERQSVGPLSVDTEIGIC